MLKLPLNLVKINRILNISGGIFKSYSSSIKMPVSSKRGAFIVFEGCDRSGKTTQCKKLVDALKAEGMNVQFCRFPERDTSIGKVISDYLEKKCELEDHAVHLLFTANRWEAVPKMKELLSQGTTLIVDRYSFSGVAFTAAKKGMDLDWCKQPEIGLPNPDAVLYLTLGAEEAAKRASYGGERYEETNFQKTVGRNYALLREDNWKEIDASKSIHELHEEIKTIVKDIIAESEHKELLQLWTTEKYDNQRNDINGIGNHINGEGDITSETNGVTITNETEVVEPVTKKPRQDSDINTGEIKNGV